jgi:site-specific DNA-methyltransferase (adenine-specific)
MKIKAFKNKITQGDALEILRQIPGESVDMAFADPPFNLNKKYSNYKDDRDIIDYLEWCYQWLDEMVRVVKPTGSILVHNVPRWLTYYAAHLNKTAYFRHWIAWDAGGAPLGKTLLPNHYGILFYVKQPKGFKFFDLRAIHRVCRVCGAYLKDYGGKKALMHPYGTLLSDVWTDLHRIRHNKRRDQHPCQLPEPLLERLVLMTTDPGDIVLDPFVGAGTTAIAAKRMGRAYIGIDIDPAYVQITTEKLVRTDPTTINGCYVSQFIGKVVTLRDKDYPLLNAHFGTKLRKIENHPHVHQETFFEVAA